MEENHENTFVEAGPIVADNEVIVLQQEQGEILMMRKILLQSEKEIERELEQRKTFFRTKCKLEGKCCNLIICGGSSENLVSMEVVNKLNLKCTPNFEAYMLEFASIYCLLNFINH